MGVFSPALKTEGLGFSPFLFLSFPTLICDPTNSILFK